MEKSSDKFYNEISEIISLLKLVKSKNSVQVRIMLKNKLKILVNYINDLNYDGSIPEKEKREIIIKSVTRFRELLNIFPIGENVKLLKMEYLSFYNFVKTVLLNTQYKSGEIVSYSTANILMDLLMEPIEIMEELPDFPDINNATDFMNKVYPILNMIQSSFGIYMGLITSMNLIHYKDLINWGNNAIQLMKLKRELLIDKLDINALLATREIKDINKFMSDMLDNAFLFFNIDETLTALTALNANNFENMEISKILTDNDDDLTLIHQIKKYSIDIIDIFDNAVALGYININDRVQNNEYYNEHLLLMAEIEFKEGVHKFYMQNSSIESVYELKNIELVAEIIAKGEVVINHFKKLIGEAEEIGDTFYTNDAISMFDKLFPFYSLYSIYNHDESILYKVIKEYRDLTQPYEDKNQIEFEITLNKLFVLSRLNKPIDFDTIFSELYGNLEKLQLSPRKYLASILILINIAPLLNNEVNINELLEKAKEYGIVQEQSELSLEFEKYMKYISDPLLYPMAELLHRTKLVKYDVITIVIPDFENYYLDRNLTPIKYIPFNRECDKVF